MKTLIINLTRFGDLLQTQPAVAGLAGAGHETGVLCLENFAPAAKLLGRVDRVIAFPGASLLAGLDSDWRKSLARLRTLAREMADEYRPGRVLNLTSSLSGRLLARLIGGDTAQGFVLDEFGFGLDTNQWAAFLQTSSMHRGCSPFNLVDIFTRISGLDPVESGFRLRPPGREQAERARDLLSGVVPGRARGLVVFQLGASEDRRRWPVEFFARLGKMVWSEMKLWPVLVGASGEKDLAARYADMGGPGADLAGETSLTDLAGVIGLSELLVTNDTGTMHLAAGLGKPIVAVFLATAQPWDTGPYLAGSISLEPDLACHPCAFGKRCARDLACRRAVTPEAALAAIRLRLGGEKEQVGDFTGSRVWVSEPDEHGFMSLKSVSGHEREDRTKWVRIQRHYYRQFLDREPVAVFPDAGCALSPETGRKIADVLDASGRMLFLLSEQAQLLNVRPSEGTKKKFMGLWQRLSGMWENHEHFSVLGRLWQYQSQQAGRDLARFRELSARYLDLIGAWSRMPHLARHKN